MRYLSVFLAPLAGICILIFSLYFLETEITISNEQITIFIIYIFAIIVQILFVEVAHLILARYNLWNFANYLKLAYWCSGSLGFLAFLFQIESPTFKFEQVVEVFLFFFTYSIGNSLAYNYLYFNNQKAHGN
jgi:hypothetical protein